MRSLGYVPGVKESYKKTSRTRTGCLTCKSRRIKCDEAKPRCHRCVKSGRECRGYNPPKTWVFEMQRGSNMTMPDNDYGVVSTRTSSPFNGMPLRVAEEPRMQHLLQRFFTYTTASNALYGNRQLWTVLLPQLVHQEAAVKHLGVALVSITNTHAHQAQITGVKPGPNDNLEYFKHIDKALRRITGQKGTFPPAFVLPCCLLLALAESLRTGSPFPSVQHIRAGVNIINMWKDDESRVAGSSLEWAEIVPICSPFFAGLVRRATAVGACENLIETSPWAQVQDVDLTHVPPVFESIQPAAFCLDAIVGFWVIPLLTGASAVTARQPFLVQELLKKFIVTFDLFVEKRLRYNPSSNELAKIAMLKAGHCAATVIAKCYPSDSEGSFDDVYEHFAEIVSLFDDLQENSRSWPELNSNNLQTPTGRIMPLFLTATKCRDWTTRRHALQLLSAFQECREAAWNGRVAYCIAEAVMSLETSDKMGLTNHGPVPETSRIRLNFADYEKDVENILILSYKRFPYNQLDTNTVKVMLTNPEDIKAAGEMDWTNEVRLFTTPPFLTNVSPWTLFCKRSAPKIPSQQKPQGADLFKLAKQYHHDHEISDLDSEDAGVWPE